MRTYKPLGQRIIVEILPFEEKKSAGGLIVETDQHQAFQAKRLRGKVLKVGPKASSVNEGDVIIFEDFAGVPLDFTKVDIVWMEEDQVVAIESQKEE